VIPSTGASPNTSAPALFHGYPARVRAEDLHFLFANEDAASLVLAWHLVGAVPGMSETAIVRAWSRCSGVGLYETRRLAPVLMGAKICLDGGNVAPAAEAVARNLVAIKVKELRTRAAPPTPPTSSSATSPAK
jgi:hypothetical protein